jgi:hypothetical protein
VFFGYTLLILGRALPIECKSCQAEREDKEGRQDGDGPAAATPVAANARPKKVPRLGTQFDAVDEPAVHHLRGQRGGPWPAWPTLRVAAGSEPLRSE